MGYYNAFSERAEVRTVPEQGVKGTLQDADGRLYEPKSKGVSLVATPRLKQGKDLEMQNLSAQPLALNGAGEESYEFGSPGGAA